MCTCEVLARSPKGDGICPMGLCCLPIGQRALLPCHAIPAPSSDWRERVADTHGEDPGVGTSVRDDALLRPA